MYLFNPVLVNNIFNCKDYIAPKNKMFSKQQTAKDVKRGGCGAWVNDYYVMSAGLRTTNRPDFDFNPEIPETEVWTT
jgi:hypothetical protein